MNAYLAEIYSGYQKIGLFEKDWKDLPPFKD